LSVIPTTTWSSPRRNDSNWSVKALVYVAAFAPDMEESVAALSAGFPASIVETNAAAPVQLAGGSRDLYVPEGKTKLLVVTQRPWADAA